MSRTNGRQSTRPAAHCPGGRRARRPRRPPGPSSGTAGRAAPGGSSDRRRTAGPPVDGQRGGTADGLRPRGPPATGPRPPLGSGHPVRRRHRAARNWPGERMRTPWHRPLTERGAAQRAVAAGCRTAAETSRPVVTTAVSGPAGRPRYGFTTYRVVLSSRTRQQGYFSVQDGFRPPLSCRVALSLGSGRSADCAVVGKSGGVVGWRCTSSPRPHPPCQGARVRKSQASSVPSTVPSVGTCRVALS